MFVEYHPKKLGKHEMFRNVCSVLSANQKNKRLATSISASFYYARSVDPLLVL
jgi:hypothetical protein